MLFLLFSFSVNQLSEFYQLIICSVHAGDRKHLVEFL